MDVVLVAGLWLDGTAWHAVVPGLQARGHRAVPVTLPGQGAPPADATLEAQCAAVVAAVDAAVAAGHRPVVVGHSAAATLAWLAADARPEAVARVVLVGGFPAGDGERYTNLRGPFDGPVGFPGWDRYAGPDVADLDDRVRRAFEARAVPVSAAVAGATVHLGDRRRFAVPVTVICPEFSPAQAREWIAAGESPELAATAHVDYVDIDSGHWPMLTQPAALADLIATAAET